NVTYGTDVISFGGGLGMNEGKIHVYNSIINNNYHCTSGGNVTQCDIGLYGGSSATLDAHNSIIGSVYSGTSSTNVTSTYTDGSTTNKTGNSGIGNTGDFYRYESINILNPDGTVKTTLDEAKAKSPIITDDKIYLLAGNSSALSGGAYIYFDGADIDNIKFGYGPNDQSITRVKGEPTTADKITLFKNGVERNQQNIVMGALYSIPAGEEYVKITGTVKGEGTVEGRSIYPNYYLVGRKATFTAEAKTGFAFEGYYDVTPVSGSSPKNKFLSTDLAFTFEVKKADDNMILEARFVNASDSAVVFTTYGGAMTSGYTATVSNQVYKHAYVADWANNKPTPTYASGGTFVDWYSDSTFTTLATFANANTKNYYAKVTDNITYNFKDDKNNAITSGVTNPSENAAIYVRNVGITFAQPTLANYFFVGWKDATNATITGLDQTATGAKTITGVFKQRTISFNMNGATSSQISPMSVTGGEQTLATPTKTSMFFGGWSFVANGTAYTIQSGQPFTAAYAQLMNDYNVEDLVLTAVWTSKPAVDFVVLTPQTFTYDGTQHAFVPQMTSGHEKETGFAITYSSDNSAYSTTAPTSAGTYYVKIYRAETITYAEYSAVIASGLVINKASLTKPTLSNTDYIYRGTAQSASLNGVDNGKMTVSNNSQTNAGTYNTVNGNAIRITLSDTANYQWSGENVGVAVIDIAWTINQMQLTITAPTVTSKVYDGTTDATSCVTKGTVSGIFAMDSGVSVAIATATFNTADIAANQVTVTYTITGDTNHNYIKPVDSTITSATITPATITY
ncbi:MAG: YDG domain-containing protein, partial [Clostridia bacterium]